MSVRYDGLVIDIGCDFIITVKLRDTDITGMTAQMAVSDPDGELIAEPDDFDVDNGGSNGTFTLKLEDTFTTDLSPTVGEMDIVIEDTLGNLIKRLRGSIEIRRTLAL